MAYQPCTTSRRRTCWSSSQPARPAPAVGGPALEERHCPALRPRTRPPTQRDPTTRVLTVTGLGVDFPHLSRPPASPATAPNAATGKRSGPRSRPAPPAFGRAATDSRPSRQPPGPTQRASPLEGVNFQAPPLVHFSAPPTDARPSRPYACAAATSVT